MVSVIMSVYNGKKYLRDAITSIVMQSYKDIELIIIDDGSTDSSIDIEKEFAKRYQNIRLYLQQNHGLGYSRNKGVSLAKGEWITFFDADDIADERMIERLVENAVSTNSDVSYVQLQWFHTPKPYVCKKNVKPVRLQKIHSRQSVMQYFQSGLGNVAAGLFRRTLFADISFPVGVYFEDNIPKLCLLIKAKRVVISTEPLYYYRDNKKSITRKSASLKKWDMLWICYRQSQILKRSKYAHDRQLWRKYYQYTAGALTNIIRETDLSWDFTPIKAKIPTYYLLCVWLMCLLEYDNKLRIKCTRVFWRILSTECVKGGDKK